MLNQHEIIQTISMIKDQHLDIRTVTMHLSLFDCISEDAKRTAAKVKEKLLSPRRTPERGGGRHPIQVRHSHRQQASVRLPREPHRSRERRI